MTSSSPPSVRTAGHRPRRRIALGLALASAATAAAAAPPPAATAPAPRRLSIAVPTWEPAAPADELPLAGELANYAAALAGGGVAVELELVPGNPYQVLAWLEEGQVDGAVVSALAAYLAEQGRGPGGVPLIKAEVPGAPRPGVMRSYPAAVRSWSCAGGEATASDDPVDDLDALLGSTLWAAAVERGLAEPQPGTPRWRLVLSDHLAAAGTAAVLSHGRRLLDDELGGAGPLAIREPLEAAFWQRLLAGADYSLGGFAPCSREPASAGPTGGPPADPAGEGDRGPWLEVELAPDGGPPPGDGWQPLPLTLFGTPVEMDDFLIFNLAAVEGVVPAATLARPSATNAEALVAWLFRSSLLRPALARQLGRGTTFPGRAYPLRVDEALDLLRAEQRATGCERLALVLPGGGVKAAYQSVLVDHLYRGEIPGGYRLLNRRPDLGSCRPPDGGALAVDAVVGNSGGALLGFFVSQLDDGDPRRLSDLLWRPGGEILDSPDVFGGLDLMRWITVLASFAVFCTVVALFSLLWPGWPFGGRRRPLQDEGSRFGLSLRLAVVLAATPLLLRTVKGPRGIEHIPAVEGVFYFLLFCLALSADHCLVRRRGEAPAGVHHHPGPLIGLAAGTLVAALPLAARLGGFGEGWLDEPYTLGGGLGGAAVAIAFVALLGGWLASMVAVRRAGGHHRLEAVAQPLAAGALLVGALGLAGLIDAYVSLAALLFCVGTLGALIAFLWLRWQRQHRYRFIALREYACALLVPIVVVLIAYAGVTALAFAGRVSWLELTGGLWAAVLGLSVAAAVVLVALGAIAERRRWQRLGWLRRGLAYLTSVHPAGSVGMVRWARLLVFFTLGFFGWNLVQAPALYGNDHAVAYLRQAVEAFDRGGDEPLDRVDFNTVFAVPANTLGSSKERYFLFTRDCEQRPPAVRRDERWVCLSETVTRACVTQVVFASGSPFPIFPPHRIQECATVPDEIASEPLVDGGFAHNVPLEAVERLGARQVLILRSDAEPAGGMLAPPPAEVAARFDGRETRRPPLLLGPLSRNLPRLVPFLFARAQALDEVSRRNLMVVALVASGESGPDPWPPLFDFRRPVVEALQTAATEDLDRRIARVESWGGPGRRVLVTGGGGRR